MKKSSVYFPRFQIVSIIKYEKTRTTYTKIKLAKKKVFFTNNWIKQQLHLTKMVHLHRQRKNVSEPIMVSYIEHYNHSQQNNRIHKQEKKYDINCSKSQYTYLCLRVNGGPKQWCFIGIIFWSWSSNIKSKTSIGISYSRVFSSNVMVLRRKQLKALNLCRLVHCILKLCANIKETFGKTAFFSEIDIQRRCAIANDNEATLYNSLC